MQQLDPSVSVIHPGWHRLFAPDLPEPLRSDLLGDARLSARIGGRIADIVAPAVGDAQDAPTDAYRTFMGDPARAIRLGGLMARAWTLSRLLSGETLRRLTAGIARADIAAAIGHRHRIEERGAAPAADAIDAAAIVADGTAFVRAWAESLPEALGRRVLLALPPDGAARPGEPDLSKTKHAIRCVEAALDAMRGATGGTGDRTCPQ